MTSTATEPPLIGQLIDGRYRIDALVGEGGFGTVYAAFHVGLGARVAIKVPRVDELPPGEIPEAIACFLDEGRTLKRLRHPAVVAALDVGLLPRGDDGVALPYLVLEWCDGPTLRDWLDEHPGPRSLDEAWSLLRPIVDALAHAHAEGIVHRDVKPANVILARGSDGSLAPRLIDFGIAKQVRPGADGGSGRTRTLSERRAFTPKYAAPEQLTGLRTGPPADVYAVALTLVEVARGEPVFDGDDDARRAVAEGEAPSAVRLGIAPGAWSEALERALAVRAGDRFADAGALLRALDVASGGVVMDVPPEERPVPPRIGAGRATAGARARAASRSGGGDEVVGIGVGTRSGRDHDGSADDSVIPSSRTARTLSAGTGRAPGRAPRSAGIGRGVTLAVALGGIGIAALVWGRGRDLGGEATPGARGSSPVSAGVAATSSVERPGEPSSSSERRASPAVENRAIASLSGAELATRATAAGLTSCQVVEAVPVVSVVCANGTVIVRDGERAGSAAGEETRVNLGHLARSHARMYGVGRFTTGGDRGLMMATSPGIIDALEREVLAGTEHGDVESGETPRAARPTPARLEGWEPGDVAARLVAMGADISWESWSRPPPSVHFLVGTESGSTMLIDGDVERWLASMKDNPTPFAYAIDGGRLLATFGTGKTGRVAFVKELVGEGGAARFGEVRRARNVDRPAPTAR